MIPPIQRINMAKLSHKSQPVNPLNPIEINIIATLSALVIKPFLASTPTDSPLALAYDVTKANIIDTSEHTNPQYLKKLFT